jgi:hypothetical protein
MNAADVSFFGMRTFTFSNSSDFNIQRPPFGRDDRLWKKYLLFGAHVSCERDG